jgi:hypothetical protein
MIILLLFALLLMLFVIYLLCYLTMPPQQSVTLKQEHVEYMNVFCINLEYREYEFTRVRSLFASQFMYSIHKYTATVGKQLELNPSFLPNTFIQTFSFSV